MSFRTQCSSVASSVGFPRVCSAGPGSAEGSESENLPTLNMQAGADLFPAPPHVRAILVHSEPSKLPFIEHRDVPGTKERALHILSH